MSFDRCWHGAPVAFPCWRPTLLPCCASTEYLRPPNSRLQQEEVSRRAKEQGHKQQRGGQEYGRRGLTPGQTHFEVGKSRRIHHLVGHDIFLNLGRDARHDLVALGNPIQGGGPKADERLALVCQARQMVPVLIRVLHPQGHANKVALHELILHTEGVLASLQERLEVRAAHGQRERPEVFGLLVLGSQRRVQLQGGAVPVLDLHLESKPPPILAERVGNMRGDAVLLVDPRVHEDLSRRGFTGLVHLVDRVHGQKRGENTGRPLDMDGVFARGRRHGGSGQCCWHETEKKR